MFDENSSTSKISRNGRNGNHNQNGTPLTIEAMMEALIQASQGRRENDGNRISEFLKLSPAAVHGSIDPKKAESWLKEIKKVFSVCHPTEADKVSFAAYRLKDSALDWWQLVERQEGNAPITWERFEEVFYEKYFPLIVRREKEREFLKLTQGNLSVADYEEKFISLSRFAINLIPNEFEKSRRFEEGILPEIQLLLCADQFPTMRQVSNKAMLIEKARDALDP